MLLRYIVSNFKSIGHPVEFSMFPTEESTDERFLKNNHNKGWRMEGIAAWWLLGPNASGKSSLSNRLILPGIISLMDRKVEKERVSTSLEVILKISEGISSFQFMFYLEGEVYEYGFSLDRHQVHEEWLMQLTEKDIEPLFTRVTDENGKTTIEIESRFARNKSKDRMLADVLKESHSRESKKSAFLI